MPPYPPPPPTPPALTFVRLTALTAFADGIDWTLAIVSGIVGFVIAMLVFWILRARGGLQFNAAVGELGENVYGMFFCTIAIPCLGLLVLYFALATIMQCGRVALTGLGDLCDSLQRKRG